MTKAASSAISKAIGFLVDSKEKVLILGVVGVVLTFLGVPPAKQDLCVAAITVAITALILGKAYAEGKLNEGVVPPNATDDVVNLAKALANNGLVNADHVSQAIGKWQELQKVVSAVNAVKDTPQPAPTPAPTPSTPTPVVATVAKCLIPLMAILCLASCVTSKQFQISAYTYAPDLCNEATAYVNADANLPLSDKMDRLNKIASLKSSVATQNAIQRPVVAPAFENVKEWYLTYVDADTTKDADEKLLRHRLVEKFQSIIDHDGARPFATTQP